MFERLKEDLQCVKDRDPAARSNIEIMLLYPGYKAVRAYRRAHWCYNHKMFFLARAISQHCVKQTNIEIHPGAQIGRRFFIDHGTGVVIGETAIIGDDCTIYQGVTLGGTGKDTGKRHPTLGNNVLVGAGAKVLGPFTVGRNAKIGAGSIVLKEVPPNATVVGIPGRVVKIDGERVDDLNQDLPDPVKDDIAKLKSEIDALKKIVLQNKENN